MNVRIVVTVLAFLVIDVRAADAGRGGGHGGGGHHGGGRGGGSRGSHRGHGRSPHIHSKCAETSPALGYRRCSSFGDWAKATLLPPAEIEFVTSSRAIQLAPLSLSGWTELEDTKFRFAADQPSPRTMTTIGIGVRGTIGVGWGFYLGLDGELGAATTALPVRAVAMNAEPITAFQAGYGQLAALIGARRTIGDTRVAVELAGGVLTVPVTARFADDPETGSEHETVLSFSARPTAEARLRVDRWITPWVTAGAFGGVDLSGRGYSAGLSLGLHLRAFDGGR